MFLHLNSAQKEIQEKVRTLVASEIAPRPGRLMPGMNSPRPVMRPLFGPGS